jgi:1,4-dihydroxy-2-naphthoate octaprenyltransferase
MLFRRNYNNFCRIKIKLNFNSHKLIQKSTIQLLRIPFSFFLMPVYWFALGVTDEINFTRAILVFVLLHALLYPASNGYNSYNDRDTESIGGLANPLQPTKQLYYITLALDVIGFAFSFFVSNVFAGCFLFFIISSRLYSWRGLRLKQYPILGYLLVISNQGALVFFAIAHGVSSNLTMDVPFVLLLAAGLLIGGFYPITQIYQHVQDKNDGVTTISILLGKRGTFIFCGILYLLAFLCLFLYFQSKRMLPNFWVIQLFFIPVVVYFLYWMVAVWKNPAKADYNHTMRMVWLASTGTNLAFITLLIMNHFG